MDDFLKDIYSVYPYKIKGNDGEIAVLKGLTLASDKDYIGAYRYPGGIYYHSASDIKHFDIIERMPNE